MSTEPAATQPFEVVIVGGGVASLEAALGLRALAGDRVRQRLIAPNREFVVRPMTVREPFSFARAQRHELAGVVAEVGAELIEDSLAAVSPARRRIETAAGATLAYDALLLAPGARPRQRYAYGITIDDRRLDDLLHGLIEDVEGGYVKRLAFVIPPRMAWPLPAYELALMTAWRAYDSNVEVDMTLLTPEPRPLAVFGETVSRSVAELLAERGIALVTGAHCEVSAPGQIEVGGAERHVRYDRIVALPELDGPAIPGLPLAEHGFIPIDDHAAVRGLDRVWAAGDATDFEVKHGGLAAQQADAAARAIAALAGAPVSPEPFSTLIQGILLTGGRPLYLSATINGGGGDSQVSEEPLWDPPAKIAAHHLGGFLGGGSR